MAEKGKEFPLSIVLRAVDRATGVIKRTNEKIEHAYAPYKKLGKQFGELKENLGLDKIGEAFGEVGKSVKELGLHFLELGAVVGESIHLVIEWAEQGDKLAKTADRLGLSVDALAQLRFAAGKSGVEVEELDGALETLSKGVGQAKAGTGRFASFLSKVSPALLHQVKAAKSTEEAFDLMADAIAKVQDPAKRTALAMAAFGNAKIINTLKGGSKSVEERKKEYLELAGSQETAARSGEGLIDSTKDLGAAWDGIKATIVGGVGPVLQDLFTRLAKWLGEHRAEIAAWIKDFAEKLPGRIEALKAKFLEIVDKVKPFWDALGGIKAAGIALAAIIMGPLISSLVSLGVAMLTTPFGLVVAGIAGLISIGYQLYENWGLIKDFFVTMWDDVMKAFASFFSWVWDLIKTYTPIGLITENWEPIKAFFKALWDDIVAIFEAAWKAITGVVDKVTGAAKTVWKYTKGALGSVFGGGDGLSDIAHRVAAQQPSIVPSGAMQGGGLLKVLVDFANTPKGARVATESPSSTDVDLNVGYQMSVP